MKKIFTIAILSIFILSSCQKKDEIEPLVAKLKNEMTAEVGKTVTLDASASTGLDRAQIEWIYNSGPMSNNELMFDSQGNQVFDATSVKPSFVATKNGTYSFTLRLTAGSEFSEASVNVTVSGILELTSLSETTTLEDINNGGGESYEPDYLINSVLTIPEGTTISLGKYTDIAFGPEGGIIVEGSLIGSNSGLPNLFEASGSSKWKGVWVKQGGSFGMSNISFSDAGAASLSGNADEAAALLVDGTATLDFADFKNTAAYGIYVGATGSISYSSSLEFTNNVNTLRIPYHLLAEFPLSAAVNLNNESATARIELYGVDGYTLQNAVQISNVSRPIYVESDIEYNYTGGSFVIQNAELRFAAGTGLIVNGRDCQLVNSKFIGQTETPGSWKGIFISSAYGGSYVDNCVIKDGGGATYATASGPAGIYHTGVDNTLIFSNNTVSDNLGIGLIADGILSNFEGNSFDGNSLAHVKMNIASLQQVATTNTFTNGVATIELQKLTGGVATNLTWKSLGAGNYYLCKTNIDANTLTMEAGLNVKFDLNKYLSVSSVFTVNGTSSEPVVLEGVTGTPGDWVGVRFTQHATIDYLTIKDAGRTGGEALFGTQNTANLFMQASASRIVNITNSTFSNGAGYGVVVKTGTSPFTVNDAASNNTMSGSLGSFKDENL
ncbi:MAG: hypothetical protein L3J74_10255 [Bacteroidales bacterium]|nr:hypothetical protein [Bacteroidales bacterium]